MKLVARWGIYLAGLVVLAFGLTLNTKAGLGVSPIISVSLSISELTGQSFGDITFLMYAFFVAAQYILRGRNSHVRDLLQLPLSLVFSRLLNRMGAGISYSCAEHSLGANFLLLALALICTGIGVAMTIDMRLIPNPADGIVQAMSERFRWELGLSKNVCDATCAGFTILLTLLVAGRVMNIGVGTVLAMLCVGRVITIFNHFLQRKLLWAAGIFDAAVG